MSLAMRAECCGRPYERSHGKDVRLFSSFPADNGLLAELSWPRPGLGMSTKAIFSTTRTVKP